MMDVMSFETFSPKMYAAIGFHVDHISLTTNQKGDDQHGNNNTKYASIGCLSDIFSQGDGMTNKDDDMDDYAEHCMHTKRNSLTERVETNALCNVDLSQTMRSEIDKTVAEAFHK